MSETNTNPDHSWLELPDPEHPSFDDPKLAVRLRDFTPLVESEGALWSFEPVEVYKTSFIWAPKKIAEVSTFHELRRAPIVITCGYYGFVKPTLAEVVAQVPDLPEINAFYLDLSKTVGIYRSGGYQRLEAVFGRI